MFQTRHVLKYTLDKILRCFDKINGWSWMTQWVVTKTHFGIRGAACLPLHRDEGWLCETRVPPTMCRLFDVNLLFCEITQYPFFFVKYQLLPLPCLLLNLIFTTYCMYLDAKVKATVNHYESHCFIWTYCQLWNHPFIIALMTPNEYGGTSDSRVLNKHCIAFTTNDVAGNCPKKARSSVIYNISRYYVNNNNHNDKWGRCGPRRFGLLLSFLECMLLRSIDLVCKCEKTVVLLWALAAAGHSALTTG